MNGVARAGVQEPLLSVVVRDDDNDEPEQAATAAADAADAADAPPAPPPPPPPPLPPPAEVDPASARLLARLAHLLRTARAWKGALCLALLSVAESYVISRSGAVAGSFYKVLIDGTRSGGGGGGDAEADTDADAAAATANLRRVFLAAACWYGSAALLASAKSALADGLAWAWRARLAAEMQRLYLRGAAHYRLARGGGGGNGGGKKKNKPSDAPPPPPPRPPTLFVDSPDQRLAQDLPNLTRALADAAAVLAAAPFGVCWYAALVRRAFGGALWPVAAAALFFALGALAQRSLVRRVARLVFALEAAEGAYRFAHARLRGAEAEGVALYSSCSEATAAEAAQEEEEQQQQRQQQRRRRQAAPAELAALEARLGAVLRAEGRLIPARWALAAATRLIDYAGALLNYACVAAAVFGVAGAAFAPEGGGGGDDAPSLSSASPGDVAQRVSVASFYLLTLIYSFTQVLDLSRTVSDAAALAARVGGLHEALQRRAAAGAAAGAEGGGDGDSDGDSDDYDEEGAASGSGSRRGNNALSQPLLELRSVRLSTAAAAAAEAAVPGGGRGGALVASGLSIAVSAAALPPPPRGRDPPPASRHQQPLVVSSLLIVGPSGVGKTTLVRAIAGLAPLDEGEIRVGASGPEGGGSSNIGSGVFFVPQRPLAAPGATLRLQLTYPHGPCACSLRSEVDDEDQTAGGKRRGRPPGAAAAAATLALGPLGLGWRGEQQRAAERRRQNDAAEASHECRVCGGDAHLLALLDEVGLGSLPARLGLRSLDAPLRLPRQGARAAAAKASSSDTSNTIQPLPPAVAPDWASVLSPGELQRLAFARLLRANPKLAVLDEPVASLPPAAARALYDSLARRSIAYVSCGHEGGGLERVHEATLRILGDGNGGWTLEKN